ncbi:hypothetical protein ACFL96_19605 [Thermoproteota archaeon]
MSIVEKKMVYGKDHTDDHCDKCCKKVGKENLKKVPFLYLDKNDETHPDMSEVLRAQGYRCDDGYRQYYVCKDCERK